jgi:predicted nuclease of predicted toxin-antitoxin system
MKLLLDMNLSPALAELLEQHGFAAVHGMTVGLPTAEDREILRWAKNHGYVVVTHDLDFGAILAATGFHSPSVIQIRCLDNHPDTLCPVLVRVLSRFEHELLNGALIILDENKTRARMLPLNENMGNGNIT